MNAQNSSFRLCSRNPWPEGLQSDREPAGSGTSDVRSTCPSAATWQSSAIRQVTVVAAVAEVSASLQGGIDILSQNDRQHSHGESFVRYVQKLRTCMHRGLSGRNVQKFPGGRCLYSATLQFTNK